MHVENRAAALQVGRADQHLPVEAARAKQGRVEILQPVRRAHHDDLVARAEAVELDEQLVQRLVLLAVERRAAARLPDRVELVDEDDRRRVLARLVEELADACRAETGEHLDERRRALRVEARARLVRDGLRGERLAGPGWPVEEDALRHARAERLEATPGRAGSRRSPAAPPSPRRDRRRRPTSPRTSEPGVISIGFTRGISLTVFQSRQTTTHIRRKNATGSQVSAKFDMKRRETEAESHRRLASTTGVPRPKALRRPPSTEAEADATLAPSRGQARRPRLVEAARGFLDERDVPAPGEEAANRSVVAHVRGDAEEHDLLAGSSSSSSRSAFGFVKTSKLFFSNRNSRPRSQLRRHLGQRERHGIELLRLGDLLRAARPAQAVRRIRRPEVGLPPRSRRRSARGRRPMRRAGCPRRAPPRRAAPSPARLAPHPARRACRRVHEVDLRVDVPEDAVHETSSRRGFAR